MDCMVHINLHTSEDNIIIYIFKILKFLFGRYRASIEMILLNNVFQRVSLCHIGKLI